MKTDQKIRSAVGLNTHGNGQRLSAQEAKWVQTTRYFGFEDGHRSLKLNKFLTL